MDNQYNYNTPNDQFQNQATGNGGPDFHFGQTDPDFSHRKKEKNFLFFKIFNGFSDSTSFQRRLFMSFLFIAIPVISGILILAFSIIQLHLA